MGEAKADYASRHSTSIVAKLMTQVETQQIKMQHYKRIVDTDKEVKRKLADSLARSRQLNDRLDRLTLELADARANQSPVTNRIPHSTFIRLTIF